ncbi:PREDICTED: proteoglycan 3-like [Galeopterus variegatus]|uniref:Proteoglycan 3-like n=1 Tax=Galeopterus variegatus TaxID=482537 RepID=A0ABM0R953_GALVR|nr:PREDICTED: proteoglycan 3-like [Galeopterus variegatus]
MKCLLLLPLLLLGTVSALFLENDAPHLESLETEADLGQDLDGSGEQKSELALTEEVIQSKGEEVEASACQNTFEDEEAMEPDPAALDKDLQCPRKEDTVQLHGSPECKTCRYVLVRSPMTFSNAQNVCRRCYQGNLVSIHNDHFNYLIQRSASRLNQAQVWIGGILKGWFLWKKYCWTDGSSWNFEYWASGEPRSGSGCCVAMSTRAGHWRRIQCETHLPFVCSF